MCKVNTKAKILHKIFYTPLTVLCYCWTNQFNWSLNSFWKGKYLQCLNVLKVQVVSFTCISMFADGIKIIKSQQLYPPPWNPCSFHWNRCLWMKDWQSDRYNRGAVKMWSLYVAKQETRNVAFLGQHLSGIAVWVKIYDFTYWLTILHLTKHNHYWLHCNRGFPYGMIKYFFYNYVVGTRTPSVMLVYCQKTVTLCALFLNTLAIPMLASLSTSLQSIIILSTIMQVVFHLSKWLLVYYQQMPCLGI